MRIVYIADSTSIHTQRWLAYFVKRGHEIYIITIGRKELKLSGVHHLANFDSFKYNSISFWKTVRETRKIIRKVRPHILHAHFVEQYGWLASLAKFHPFFLTGWGTDILHLPHASRFKVGKRLTQYALRQADTLTAISEYLKSEMVKLGADDVSTHVAFCGVDTRTFHPEIDVSDLKRVLRIGDSQPVVLTNRHHVSLYNNDVVIKSMAEVLKRFPNTILVMQNAGGGSDTELKKLCRDIGVEQSVRFVPQTDYENMPAIYNLADIYVSVPNWDAGPVSLKEAMACGAVPVISEIPAPMEWVRNDANGKVVPVRDVKALADALIDLLGDDNAMRNYASGNRKLIQEKAEHNILMEKIECLYQSAIPRAIHENCGDEKLIARGA